jgi:putative restriction endonuclease
VHLDDEIALRQRIMRGLDEHLAASGGTITRAELEDFPFGSGERRRLADRSRGIWNPRDLRATLSVISNPKGPYDDRPQEGGLFRYAYRAGSTDGDNRKLRQAYALGLPIILLRTIVAGLFMPVYPVYVLGDDFARREFVLALDEGLRFVSDPENPREEEQRYAARIAWQRLHQPEFRVRVLRAYEGRCTVCRLGHKGLLDAAHIIGDRIEGGQPVVPNGLSLCKIHHAAYDRDLLGITGDGEVRINARLLEEIDGPMLRHGLQEMHRRAIVPPRRREDRPDAERLDIRFQRFLAAA